MAVRYAVPFHGTRHLDYPSICSVHNGRLFIIFHPIFVLSDCFGSGGQVIQPFYTSRWPYSCFLCRLQEYDSSGRWWFSSTMVVSSRRFCFCMIAILLCTVRNVILSYLVWLTATRTAKLLPHLWHSPHDIIYVPAFILFGYYFSIMKIYALFTLHEVRRKANLDMLHPSKLFSRIDWLGYSCWNWRPHCCHSCCRCQIIGYDR